MNEIIRNVHPVPIADRDELTTENIRRNWQLLSNFLGPNGTEKVWRTAGGLFVEILNINGTYRLQRLTDTLP